MSLLSALAKHLQEQLDAELIGGVSLGKTIPCVVLEVAFTPVVFSSRSYEHDPPKPVHIAKIDGAYCIPLERLLTEETVREARCRYLLLRDYYARQLTLGTLSYYAREQVLAYYFPDGLFLPQIITDQIRKEAQKQ